MVYYEAVFLRELNRVAFFESCGPDIGSGGLLGRLADLTSSYTLHVLFSISSCQSRFNIKTERTRLVVCT
jgi:hypothetical protein